MAEISTVFIRHYAFVAVKTTLVFSASVNNLMHNTINGKLHVCFFLLESCHSGNIRLRGSSSGLTGWVDVCTEHSWTAICADNWDNSDASVACKQLGFSPYGMYELKWGIIVIIYFSCLILQEL